MTRNQILFTIGTCLLAVLGGCLIILYAAKFGA